MVKFLASNYALSEKVSNYGVFSSPYFPVFGLNIEKYGPEKSSYLDSFHAVMFSSSRHYLLVMIQINWFSFLKLFIQLYPMHPFSNPSKQKT